MRVSKAIVIGLGLALSPINLAHAEDFQWLNYIGQDRALFLYGVPETDFVPLAFECSNGRQELHFSYWHEPANARDGMDVPVMLHGGGQSISLTTKGTRWEMDDLFVIEGNLPLDDTFIAIFTSTGVLSVELSDAIEEYPLEGAREVLKPFVAACSGR